MEQFNARMEQVLHTQQTILGIAGRFWYNWLSLLLWYHPADEISTRRDSRAPLKKPQGLGMGTIKHLTYLHRRKLAKEVE